MIEIDRLAIKAAMIIMIANKEGLGQSGAPNVAPLEEKLDLEGQIGAKLRNELMAEIEAETNNDSTATPPAEKKTAPKPTAPEEEPDIAKPSAKTKTSNLTIRDGVPHRVYFEDGKQVKTEKVKLPE